MHLRIKNQEVCAPPLVQCQHRAGEDRFLTNLKPIDSFSITSLGFSESDGQRNRERTERPGPLSIFKSLNIIIENI